MTRTAPDSDDGLADFGYPQTLERSIGTFASFAAGASGLAWFQTRGRHQLDTLPEHMARTMAGAPGGVQS